MSTTTPSNLEPACEKCNDTGVISVVIGSGQEGVIGCHMEMQACGDCTKDLFEHARACRQTLSAGEKPVEEYDSPDGRTPVAHYQRGGIECIDAMKAISTPAEFQAFCRLTAFKYLWRLGEKDDPAREAKKAADYMRWLEQSRAE